MKKNTGKKIWDEAWREAQLIERYLNFKDKVILKKTLGLFIDELQKDISAKKIRKVSPLAEHINSVQKMAIEQYNKPKYGGYIELTETTENWLRRGVEEYFNKRDNSLETEVINDEKKFEELKGLNGLNNPFAPPTVNLMPSTEFLKKQFNKIGLQGKWKILLGDPSPGFTMMVFGLPKLGKSYLCVYFAGYLARNHGRVLYVAREEGLGDTLKEKLKGKNVAHENLIVADDIPADLSGYEYIFLDSVSKLNLRPADLEALKKENPGKSFIYVFQSTKDGKARGRNEFVHDVDIVVEIPEIGKAIQYGRFNQGGEMDIFEPEVLPIEPEAELNGVEKSTTQKFELAMIADTSDKGTKLILNKIWDKSSEAERIKILNRKGFSAKYASLEFNDLTPAVQQTIVMCRHSIAA